MLKLYLFTRTSKHTKLVIFVIDYNLDLQIKTLYKNQKVISFQIDVRGDRCYIVLAEYHGVPGIFI